MFTILIYMNYLQKYKTFAVTFVVLVSIASIAFAHKGATGIVKERMDTMKDISTQMKLMKKMIRTKQPYNA